MLAQLLGNLDASSAAVAIAFFICVGIPITVAVANHESRALAQRKQFELETDREIKTIASGRVITSHRAE